MDQLIPIASKLQDVLGAVGQTASLDLPQIVVIGGQSSGKSSVLENIVGRSFLPRGTGIVTRRPLVLQLYNTRQVSLSSSSSSTTTKEGGGTEASTAETHATTTKSSSSATTTTTAAVAIEWGEFLHLPDKKYYDFHEIRQEIARETNRLTGNNRNIDSTPIHLKIFSPRVLALTLVDLPGIAKVPVGDQPEDIEQQIQDMCVQYASNPNAIILAVTSANTDIANSDALKLAQEIDPEGNRTVGVLTKVDLMDDGTDCTDILLNQVIPLRRGYVAVVNRGQKDIMSNTSIRDGLKKEEKFFHKHPVYSRDRSILSKCGTGRLTKSLNSMLMHHIRDCLPDLKTRIGHMMTDVQKELDALGTAAHNASRSTRGAALLSLLSKFANNFSKVLEGRIGQDLDTNNRYNDSKTPGRSHNNMTGSIELMGGARISYVFTEVFARSLNGVGAFDGLSDEEIRTVISNANGTRPALFVPEISFDILVRRQLTRLEQPGIQCVDMIYEELQRISLQSEPSELTRFPVLRDRMMEVVSTLLRRCVGPTQMMVSNLVKIELAYVNTSHPDFIGGSRAVARLMDKIGKENTNNSMSHVSAAATPLSPKSTSLNKTGYSEGAGEYQDAVMANTSPAAVAANHNAAGGDNKGLMNFIFRGQNDRSTHPTAATPSSSHMPDGPPRIIHLPQVPDTMKQTDFTFSDRERVEMEVIKSLVESYFAIVRKNFIDMVPKTIMYFLVNHVRDSLQNELVSELYREAEMGQLLQEADDIAARRQTCVEMKDLLGKALDIVNEVRDYNTYK